MSVKWIKLSIGMFEDEKIRLIEQMPDADTILVIWMKLLLQAGKTNSSGYVFLSENIPYTEEMLAAIFNRPINMVRMSLEVFSKFDMIEIDEDSFISVSNWEKHQNIEGLERIREQNRKRVARHRERKQLNPLKTTCNATRNVSVIKSNGIEEELDLEEDKNNTDVYKIFEHYLSKGIIQHKRITNAIRSAINARLKDYSFDELIQVIDNYAIVYPSDKYWFTQKYSLADLMRDKDVRKFIDDAEPLKNYAVNKAKWTSKEEVAPPIYHELGGREY